MSNHELNLNQTLVLGNEVFIPNLETPDSVIPLLSLSLIAVSATIIGLTMAMEIVDK